MIVVSFGASLALWALAFAPVRLSRRPVFCTAAGLSVLYVVTLTLAVFAEDAYTNSGSNWSNRTTQAHVIYLVAAAIGTASAIAFGLAAVRRTMVRRRALFAAVGAVDLLMAFVVAVAFLAN
ncbi:MAG TPA: hypothetical protein VLJ76_02140 [Gaiellaceae bacterium]|nr:hypothetical protein [Gaiellaceae bacterium]